MNRLLLLASASLFALTALAQQPGPENSNSNRMGGPDSAGTTSTPANPANTKQPSGAAIQQPDKPSGNKSIAPADSNTLWSAEPAGAQPTQPTTEMIPQGAAMPSADPVLEPKGLPDKDMSLIGGTTKKVDKIRNRVEIEPFGGGNPVTVRFDDRSHVYRDGRETTVTGINKGDRIYADTMIVEGHIFARNLRVVTKSGPAESSGEVRDYDAQSGRVDMLDTITGQTVTFFVDNHTAMQKRGDPASPSDLRPGTLVDVMFAPERHGGTADQISILAMPGEEFIFAGRVTSLDLSHGLLSLDNDTDEKNYELRFTPANIEDRDALRVGSEITARAQFDGRSYFANQVSVRKGASAQQ